jgi:hypothetical protein
MPGHLPGPQGRFDRIPPVGEIVFEATGFDEGREW